MEDNNPKEQAAQLPDSPGVYKFLDSHSKVIYVGKAKSLKKRVTSYFIKNQQSYKTTKLVNNIHKIEYIVVKTEKDALLLENSLIKTIQPKYNINLKDDKTYPYICVTRERFPRVFPIRRRLKHLGSYYGPFTKVGEVREILDLIRKLYTIRTCKLNITKEAVLQKKFKVCLEYHIKNCKGPCEGLQSEEDYEEDVEQIHQLLKGNISHVKSWLKEKMQTAAAEMAFEKAQFFKECLEKLEHFKQKSQVVSEKVNDCEVYTISSETNFTYLNFIKINEGRIVHAETKKVKKHLDEPDEEVLEFFVNYIRLENESKSNEIFTNLAIEIDGLNVHVPERGEKRELIELSLRNITEYKRISTLNDETSETEEINPALLEMQKQMQLKTPPFKIECFDNSNIQGTSPVAGMVCFINGKPAKKEYRTFHIKTVVGPDDFSSMKEVVFRRYSRLKEEGKSLPDLILIDGGKGQLNAAVEALREADVYGEVAIASIAKRLEEIYVPGDEFPLHFDKKSPALKLFQQIRDEVHRFAITFHRKTRSRNTLEHKFESIKGLGKESIQALLEKYKTIKKVESAPLEDIEALIGKRRALILTEFLNNKNNQID